MGADENRIYFNPERTRSPYSDGELDFGSDIFAVRQKYHRLVVDNVRWLPIDNDEERAAKADFHCQTFLRA